ncbi:MAG: hypothetical protein RLZZ108_384 [Actinomycetota bacterium]|jgi:signal transduction histidine kinase
MFKWIHENGWLPTTYIAATMFLVFGGLDLVVLGPTALIPGAIYSLGLLFSRRLPWLTVALLIAGQSAQIVLSLTPTFSVFIIASAVLLVAAFGSGAVRAATLVATSLSSFVVLWLLTYGPYATFESIGLQIREDQKLLILCTAFVLTVGWLTLGWLLGRLAYVQLEHIGSPLDRALTLLSQARINFELARQNERLDIARDLSELLVQRIAAVVSLTEGGAYAVRTNPEAAARALTRAGEAANSAQVELRRLFDLLHNNELSKAATARLADLDALVIAYRELGYNTELSSFGEPFALDEGAETCLYKIVFESLDNVRKHTPRGTSVTVSFSWVGEGLQLLVKDNGVEFSNREQAQLGEIIEGYGVEEDVKSLIGEIDGATLSALRERAALYEGSIEAVAEPGVGFTVSAIFPNLKTVVEGR